MVKNQVLIIFLDSGSSYSFLDSSLAERIGCMQTATALRIVKVANGDVMHCNSKVKNLHGGFLTTPFNMI